jgi:hypothetical protein
VGESLDSQVQEDWRQARQRAEAAGRPVTPREDFPNPDPPTAWAEFVANARAALVKEFGEQRVAQRFAVPDDFAAFMRLDGREWGSPAEPCWWLFNPADQLCVESITSAVLIPVRDDGFWIGFGQCFGTSDQQMLYLCCDRAHPLFGAVVVGYDGYPYRDGVPSPQCRVAAKSFLEYLQNAEGFRPPEHLPVPEVPPEPLPMPSHLRGWVVPLSFEDEYLEATVRCPCGCEQVELFTLGDTQPSRTDGSPKPIVAKIDEGYYFIVQAVCTNCRAEHTLFDSRYHGCDGFLGSEPDRVEEPPPRALVPWSCVSCGSRAHTAELQLVIDYKDTYFRARHYNYFLRHGIDRWPDAFGWIDIRIRCCECDRKTPWVSLETR